MYLTKYHKIMWRKWSMFPQLSSLGIGWRHVVSSSTGETGTGTHWIGEWICLRVSVKAAGKRKISVPVRSQSCSNPACNLDTADWTVCKYRFWSIGFNCVNCGIKESQQRHLFRTYIIFIWAWLWLLLCYCQASLLFLNSSHVPLW
jgi:hypothetical protein